MYRILVGGCLVIPIFLAHCGHSPVSIEDNPSLTHTAFAFAIHPPDILVGEGGSIDASRNTSKYDSYYSFLSVSSDPSLELIP